MIHELINIIYEILITHLNKEYIFLENSIKIEKKVDVKNNNILEMKRIKESIDDFFQPSVNKRLIEGHEKTDLTILKNILLLDEYKKVDYNLSPGSLYTGSTYSNIKIMANNLDSNDYDYIRKNRNNFINKTLDDALTTVTINADPNDSSTYNDGFGGMDGMTGSKKPRR